LRDHVRPSGLILMGDIYWRRYPDPEFYRVSGKKLHG